LRYVSVFVSVVQQESLINYCKVCEISEHECHNCTCHLFRRCSLSCLLIIKIQSISGYSQRYNVWKVQVIIISQHGILIVLITCRDKLPLTSIWTKWVFTDIQSIQYRVCWWPIHLIRSFSSLSDCKPICHAGLRFLVIWDYVTWNSLLLLSLLFIQTQSCIQNLQSVAWL
jgi:hypothetical protein